jgi:hypothetical protein
MPPMSGCVLLSTLRTLNESVESCYFLTGRVLLGICVIFVAVVVYQITLLVYQ